MYINYIHHPEYMYTHQERSFTLPLFKFMHIHLLSIHQPEEEIFTSIYPHSMYIHHFNIHQEEILLHLYLPSFKFLYIHHFEYPPRGNFYFSYIYPHFKLRYNLSTCTSIKRKFSFIYPHSCTSTIFSTCMYQSSFPTSFLSTCISTKEKKKLLDKLLIAQTPSPLSVLSPILLLPLTCLV